MNAVDRLALRWQFNTQIDIDFFAKDWSKYDVRKTKKKVYIGPEAWLQM